MTEREWRDATDPMPMLEFARGRAGDRQWRRLMATFAAEVVGRVDDEPSRRVVALLEWFAAGDISRPELDATLRAFESSCAVFDFLGLPWPSFAAGRSLADDTAAAARWLLRLNLPHEWVTYGAHEWAARWAALPADAPARVACGGMCAVIRDVLGPLPFRPAAFDPAWRTEAAVALARGIDRDGAFDRMPVLADALEDAGCDRADVLAHCRAGGPHGRGCWVVELLLGAG